MHSARLVLEGGAHCQQMQNQVIGQRWLGRIQTDEMKVKTQQGAVGWR